MNTQKPTSQSDLATHIRCAACGKWVKKLGTHLNKTHGMTPGEYRARFAIPEHQKLVAPALLAKMQRNAKTMQAENAKERERHRQRIKERNVQR